MIQEAFGINDHIQDVCRRYAARDYVVVSPDLFHRQGGGTFPYSDVATAKQLLAKVTNDEVTRDVAAAVDHLRADADVGSGKLAVVGYCFGGLCAYLAATRIAGLRGAVVYYGGRIAGDAPDAPVLATSPATCPVLAHFGAADPSIPAGHIAAIRAALDAASVDNLVATYPGAGHGFACDARPAGFHADAAEAAWELTTAFLGAAFAGAEHPARAAGAASAAGRARWHRA